MSMKEVSAHTILCGLIGIWLSVPIMVLIIVGFITRVLTCQNTSVPFIQSVAVTNSRQIHTASIVACIHQASSTIWPVACFLVYSMTTPSTTNTGHYTTTMSLTDYFNSGGDQIKCWLWKITRKLELTTKVSLCVMKRWACFPSKTTKLNTLNGFWWRRWRLMRKITEQIIFGKSISSQTTT